MNRKSELKIEKSYKLLSEKENWQKDQVQPYKQLKLHSSSIDCLLYNRQFLYSGSHDRLIKKTDVQKLKTISELVGHSNGVWCMDINDSKQLLASSGSDGELILWDSKSNNKIQNSIKFSQLGSVYAVKFVNENQVLLSDNCSHFLQVDLRTNSVINEIQTLNKVNSSIQVDAQAMIAILTDFQGSCTLYDLNDFSLLAQINHPNQIRAYTAVILNKDYIYVGYQDGTISKYFYHQKSFQLQTSFHSSLDNIRFLSLNKQQNILVSSSDDGISRIFNTSNHSFIASLTGHTDFVKTSSAIIENSNQQFIATASWDQTINLYQYQF